MVSKAGKNRASRREDAIYNQMRLDVNVFCAGFRSRVGSAMSDRCSECGLIDNASHVLTRCTKYSAQREEMHVRILAEQEEQREKARLAGERVAFRPCPLGSVRILHEHPGAVLEFIRGCDFWQDPIIRASPPAPS